MSSRTGLALAGLLALGTLLRAGYLLTPVMDSDQAVFGLQARHILLGEFPVFSWGYAYIGSAQSFLDAAAFAIFGASRVVLNSIPLLLSLLFVLVTYRLGREIGGDRVGLLGASLVALAPPYLAIHGAWARHGYMDTLLVGSLILLITVRLTRRPLGESQELRLFALLGLAGGLAWWINLLSLYYLIPGVLFLLVHDWRCLLRRGVWVALGFFLLGSAPFWLWNVPHAFGTFRLFKGGGDLREAPLQVVRLVIEGLPAILGARGSRARTNLIPGLSEALLALYAAAFVWLLGRQLRHRWTKQETEPAARLLLLFLGAALVLPALSRYGETITAEGTKRYLLPLYSALPLLCALFLHRLREFSRALALALLLLPLSLHLYGNLTSYPVLTGEARLFWHGRAEDEELFRFLRARGLTRVYATDYWLAPRLTFDAREEIIFAQPSGDRYPSYTRLVDGAPRVAYLFATAQAEPFEALLEGIGATFERTSVGPYELFHDLRPPAGVDALRSVPPREWRSTASSMTTSPALAFDRDIDTSWYSGEPQRPGLFFQVDLGHVIPMAKVVLLPPRPLVGPPRGYRIELSRDGSSWEETAAVPRVVWSLDWSGGQPRMASAGRVVSAFAPREARYLRIHQTGSDPRWWWAIGELFVYGPGSDGTLRPTRQAMEHVERGRGYEAARQVREALGEYWRAARLDPELEVVHARLAALYEQAGIPIDGAAPPETRAKAFEKVGLWAKAAQEYEKEIRRTAHHQHHTDLWQRLLRAHREAGEEERARVVEERLAREFSPSVSAAVSFDDQIRFLGYRLDGGAVHPGRTLHLTYYWQSLKAARKDYAVFVHFVREGKVLFQHDHSPLHGIYPMSQWQPGEVIRDTVELVPPAYLDAATYDIVLGVWDPQTGQRLTVRDTTLTHTKDRVVVGTLPVDRRS